MATSYPHNLLHSYEHANARPGVGLLPICAYCLHLLGSLPVSAVIRREMEEHHTCAEKATAKQPAAPMPFN
jgi:hypothetical protein